MLFVYIQDKIYLKQVVADWAKKLTGNIRLVIRTFQYAANILSADAIVSIIVTKYLTENHYISIQ